MSGFFKDNPPATQVGSEDATESTIQEDAVTQTDTSGGFYQGSPDQTTTDAYTADALASKNAAEAAKTAAEAAQSAAETAKTAAETAETNAETAETNAETAETNAETAETNAAASQSAAATSATSSAGSAATATTKASEAATSATNAATSATSAETAKTAAETAETNAETAETNAASSASSASTSASNASTSATAASGSASAASTSETNAASSATAAATSATNAATSETNAASSATSASGSATTATTQAGNASTSASNAATSETNAATSATASAASASSASAAKDAALAALDNFDDRYLGQKASDPSVDNDGNALITGALYFDTTNDVMRVYDGSQWLAAYADVSGSALTINNLSDLANAATARTNLGLGTAATTDATAYATAAQGTTADNALAASSVSTFGGTLIDDADAAAARTTLGLGTAATTAASDYATAAQADQTVALTGAGATTISGTYPNFTITSTDTNTDTNTEYTAGSGLTLTGTVFSNSAPDQTVALTGSGGTTVSGTYPNFTISSAASIDGTTINPSSVQIGGTTVIDSSRNLTNIGTITATGDINLNGGNLTRNAHNTGHLEGSYNSVGNNNSASNPIYTIGSSYNPGSTTLGNMYGIGFTKASNASFVSLTGASSWGMYVAAGGVARIFLDTGDGTISSTGQHYVNGNGVWHAGNDGSGSGLDADLLDGSHKVDIQRELVNVQSVTAADSCLPSTGYGFTHFLGLGPSNNDGHILGMTWTGTTSYGAQIYVDTDPNNIMAFRSRSSTGVWTSWNTVWHTGNDGSGSGLDADLLDGQHSTSFAPSTFNVAVTPSTSDPNSRTDSHFLTNNGNAPYGSIYSHIQNHWWSSVGGNVAQHATTYNGSTSRFAVRHRYSGTWYGWSEAWTNNNDGAGSGLDADLLDGHHASTTRNSANTIPIRNSSGYLDLGWINTTSGSTSSSAIDRVYSSYDGYIRYSSSSNFLHRQGTSYFQANTWIQLTGAYGLYVPTVNGAHFLPNEVTSYGTWRTTGSRGGYDGILFDDGGNVAIMYDSSGNGGIYRQASGRWYTYHHLGNNCLAIGNSGTSSSYSAYVHGALYATGNITAYSDRRIKESIVTVDSALDKVNALRGVYYNKIDDPEKIKQIGFIAQEVNEVVPELVTYAEDVDQYGVNYGNATALLVEAVKDLTQQVKDLKAEIEEMKNA